MAKFELFLLIYQFWSLQAAQQLRNAKCIFNSNFSNRKIQEDEISFKKANSVMRCASVCMDTSTCLSFAYNKLTQTCVLFDKDFTDASLTQTVAEDGWKYYYMLKDYEGRPSHCTAPVIDELCSVFCLHYFHRIAPYSEVYAQCQTLDGGHMVRVDSALKQYCIEQILGGFSCPIYIQGRRNQTTNKWTYDDGTEITYFNWDTVNGQPTNGAGETYLGIDTFSGNFWASLADDEYGHGTVCEQT